MELPPIVSEDEWQRSHAALLAKEKAATRARDALTRSRGVEALGSVWTFLDLTPLGRQEEWEDTPPGRPQTPPYRWWQLHDEYEAAGG